METHIAANQKPTRELLYNDAYVRHLARLSIANSINRPGEVKRTNELNVSLGLHDAQEISGILDTYSDKSVVVIGSPGVGKSTIAQHIAGIVDMDIMFDSMDIHLKGALLHHEYIVDESSGLRTKRTIPFRDSPAYLDSLSRTTRQLSVYAEEHFSRHVHDKVPLIGTTPILTDKAILLKADMDSIQRNAKARSDTSREVDVRRTLYIHELIEAHTYEVFDKSDVVAYSMSYE